MSLTGKVCMVTGASRGIGKGIALQLGEAGATVYITGRTLEVPQSDPVGGSLTETAREIESRGGRCIPVQCDHAKDEDIKKVFDKIKAEQNGHLDVLVNNAYSAVKAVADSTTVPFWEQPETMWDTVNNVGLRNHYMCSIYASRIMVPRKQGLIVNVSSVGGLRYLFNVPYGIGKEACDRMAVDCAIELRKHNVAFVSLWPGIVKTENMLLFSEEGRFSSKYNIKSALEDGESIEYSGKAIKHLALDPDIMKKSGRILLSSDLGIEYGFTDIDGRKLPSFRQINRLPGLKAWWLPNFVKLPYWMLSLGGNKF